MHAQQRSCEHAEPRGGESIAALSGRRSTETTEHLSTQSLVSRDTSRCRLHKEACVSRIKALRTPKRGLCDGAQADEDSAQRLVSQGSSRSRQSRLACATEHKALRTPPRGLCLKDQADPGRAERSVSRGARHHSESSGLRALPRLFQRPTHRLADGRLIDLDHLARCTHPRRRT